MVYHSQSELVDFAGRVSERIIQSRGNCVLVAASATVARKTRRKLKDRPGWNDSSCRVIPREDYFLPGSGSDFQQELEATINLLSENEGTGDSPGVLIIDASWVREAGWSGYLEYLDRLTAWLADQPSWVAVAFPAEKLSPSYLLDLYSVFPLFFMKQADGWVSRDNAGTGMARQARLWLESVKDMVLDAVEDIIVYYYPDLTIAWANRAAADLVGVRPIEMMGRACHEVMRGLNDPCEDCPVQEALATGEPRERRVVASDGTILWSRGFPVMTEAGDIIGLIEISIDISERVGVEEERRIREKQLRDIIDVSAHELVHPASVFQGYASTLLSHWDRLELEDIRESLEAIMEASNRLVRIARSLMYVSNIENNRVPLEREKSDPFELINAVLDELADGEVLPVRVNCVSGVNLIWVDPRRIETVLLVLVENAVRHSPAGEMVDVSCSRMGAETVFSVADRGPGIPPKHRLHLFERFYQVEEVIHHHHPGMGLGLYIAKKIVDAHSGWIKMSPRNDGGSVFSFGIPAGMPSTE